MRCTTNRVALVVAWTALVWGSAASTVRGDVADDIFYVFMPIAWRDANGDAYRFGDFGGMTASLDYLQDLGITAVWMTPIFPSPAYHGYQHGPADQINPWFGNETEFWSFVSAAHAHGIKVFIDFVVYGISQDTIWFQDSYANPSSPYDDWLAYTNSANTSYLGSVYTTWNGDTVGFIHWNLNNATVTDLVTNWALHWLDPDGDGDPADGIDGYRLDHVSAYHPQESPWGYDIAWWEAWKADLLAVKPDVFTFAEQADWGSHGADLLSAHDAAFTKPFEFAARSALSGEQAAGLYSEMLNTLATLPAGKTYLATLGDHDVDRLTSVIGGSLDKAEAAAAILLTQPFPPVLYFGDEIGMLGTKQSYGSDANDIPMREPFKWNAVAGPPMSNYWVLNSPAYSNPFSHDNDGRSVQEQQGVSGSLLETYRTLITARTAHAALRRGTYHEVPNSSSSVWAFVRHLADTETLLVAVNLSGSTRNPSLNLSEFTIPGGSTTVQDILTGTYLANMTDANKSAYPLSLSAYGYKILALNVLPPEPEPQVIDGLGIPTDLGPGALVATQDNATGLGDNINELDQLFVRVEADGLDLGIPGNLGTDGTALMLFFDGQAGGQNVLNTDTFSTPPNNLPAIDGMILDAGFVPDVVVHINAYGGTIYVDHYTLATAGGGTKRYVGAGTVNDLDGFLSGGSNPNGLLMAVNNSNTAGVTATDASEAGTAASGFEGFLPFADLSIAEPPTGTFKLMAMLVRSNGEVGNQFLPGLGGGYPNLGFVPLNLNNIPGEQFVTLSLSSLPGDWDGDGDVDVADYGHFFDCLTGPNNGPLGPGCNTFDFDTDLDVDLKDFDVFQSGFTS
ncbi:MAG: alpha-amylase family glycosyl hydrolase [Planctomycetota bacterium]